MRVLPSASRTRKYRRVEASPSSGCAVHPSPTKSVRNFAASSGRDGLLVIDRRLARGPSHPASATQTKNCDEALFGSFERAMETTPRAWWMLLNSAATFLPEPPVPHVEGEPEIVFGSPPWIMKPGKIGRAHV